MMGKRVRNAAAAAAALACVCLLFRYMGMRIGETFFFADVDDDAVFSEYPELEITERDREWLNTIIQLEEVQKVFSSAENARNEFRLSDTGLDDFYQFPGNDCSISVGKEFWEEADDYVYMIVTFEPAARDQKVLEYGFFVSYSENSDFQCVKQLKVYRPGGGAAMTFDDVKAYYYNFDGALWTEVPGVYLAWADMTIFRFTFPRAEILARNQPAVSSGKGA